MRADSASAGLIAARGQGCRSTRAALAISFGGQADDMRAKKTTRMTLNGSGRSRSVATAHMPDHDLVAAQFADRHVATDSASIVVPTVNVKIAPIVIAAIGECRESPQRARNGGGKRQFSHSNTPPCRWHYGVKSTKRPLVGSSGSDICTHQPKKSSLALFVARVTRSASSSRGNGSSIGNGAGPKASSAVGSWLAICQRDAADQLIDPEHVAPLGDRGRGNRGSVSASPPHNIGGRNRAWDR